MTSSRPSGREVYFSVNKLILVMRFIEICAWDKWSLYQWNNCCQQHWSHWQRVHLPTQCDSESRDEKQSCGVCLWWWHNWDYCWSQYIQLFSQQVFIRILEYVQCSIINTNIMWACSCSSNGICTPHLHTELYSPHDNVHLVTAVSPGQLNFSWSPPASQYLLWYKLQHHHIKLWFMSKFNSWNISNMYKCYHWQQHLHICSTNWSLWICFKTHKLLKHGISR